MPVHTVYHQTQGFDTLDGATEQYRLVAVFADITGGEQLSVSVYMEGSAAPVQEHAVLGIVLHADIGGKETVILTGNVNLDISFLSLGVAVDAESFVECHTADGYDVAGVGGVVPQLVFQTGKGSDQFFVVSQVEIFILCADAEDQRGRDSDDGQQYRPKCLFHCFFSFVV